MPIPSEFTDEEAASFAEQGVGGLSDNDVIDSTATVVDPGTGDLPGSEGTAAEEPALDANGQPVAPVADPAAPAAPVAPPQGFVPHAALHAERLRYQQLAQQMATVTARTNAILSQRQQDEQAPLPDLDTDPVGYIQGLEQRLASFENAQREDAANRQLDSQIESDEANFTAYTPDYPQAGEHYVQSRARELLQFYPPEQAKQIMTNEVRQIAQQAWQRGIPTAQAIYQLAQARGYTPGAAPPPVPTLPAPPAAPALGAAPPSPAAIVRSVKDGQAASRSLSAGAGAPNNDVTAEALANMSDEEFESYLKLGTKGSGARFAKLVGGG